MSFMLTEHLRVDNSESSRNGDYVYDFDALSVVQMTNVLLSDRQDGKPNPTPST